VSFSIEYAYEYVDSYTTRESYLNKKKYSHSIVVDGMSRKNKSAENVDIKRPLVIRALRRSNVRKKIAEYLFDISPSCSYTSEIAYNVKTTPTNVIGAIRGMGSRYKEEGSLISLDLIEEKSGGRNIRLYSLTPFGKEMIENLRDK
jgi:predicted transcriptional regulator with HTH domain